MNQRDKLKEALEEIHKLSEESIMYLPILESLDSKENQPLIKDEKIRKVVRAWAEVNNIKEVHYDSGCNELNDIARNTISFNARIVEQKFIEDKDYTIAELCGEEENETTQ